MIHIYLAHAYSDNPQARTLEAIHVADELVARRYAVFSPHCHFHWWNLVTPHDYEVWMTQCLAWVAKCDVLFRMDSVSPGADREVALARELGIPVVHSLDQLDEMEAAQ